MKISFLAALMVVSKATACSRSCTTGEDGNGASGFVWTKALPNGECIYQCVPNESKPIFTDGGINGEPQYIFGCARNCQNADRFPGCPKSGYCRRQLRKGENLSFDPSPEESLEIISSMGADPDAPFLVKHDLLPLEACEAGEAFVERSIKEGNFNLPNNHDNEINVPVSVDDLIHVFGAENTLRLVQEFNAYHGEDKPITEIYFARHAPSDKEGDKYVTPWHKDCYYTLEMNLGDTQDESWLVHLTRNGPERFASSPGTGVFHGNDIVHGTPSFFEEAHKYLLVIKHHPADVENKHPKETILTQEVVRQYMR